MLQIVLVCAFSRAPNRAFFCISSCSKSCFFLRFVVLQIVLFSAFSRAPNRAFFCVSSCSKSCFFLRFVVHQIVLFSAVRRAPNRALNRAFFCACSCAKLCFFPLFSLHIAASVPPCLMYYNVCLLAKTLGLALPFFPKVAVLQMVLQIVLFYLVLFKTIKGKAQFIASFSAPEKLQFL